MRELNERLLEALVRSTEMVGLSVVLAHGIQCVHTCCHRFATVQYKNVDVDAYRVEQGDCVCADHVSEDRARFWNTIRDLPQAKAVRRFETILFGESR